MNDYTKSFFKKLNIMDMHIDIALTQCLKVKKFDGLNIELFSDNMPYGVTFRIKSTAPKGYNYFLSFLKHELVEWSNNDIELEIEQSHEYENEFYVSLTFDEELITDNSLKVIYDTDDQTVVPMVINPLTAKWETVDSLVVPNVGYSNLLDTVLQVRGALENVGKGALWQYIFAGKKVGLAFYA